MVHADSVLITSTLDDIAVLLYRQNGILRLERSIGPAISVIKKRIDEHRRLVLWRNKLLIIADARPFLPSKKFYLIVKIEEVVAIKLIVAVYVHLTYVHLMTLIFHGTFHVQWH